MHRPSLSRKRGPLAVRLGALVACVTTASMSWAANPKCVDLTPAPIIGVGGSAQKNLFKKLGTAIAGVSNPTYTLVYASPGACFGIDPFTHGTKLTKSANYWDAGGNELTCDFNGDESPSFGCLGNAGTLCDGQPNPLPDTIADVLGPVQSVNFIVHKQSSQQSISAAAAFFAFGFGKDAPSLPSFPWTNEQELIVRNNTSFVQLFVSLATGVPATKFRGVDAKTNDGSANLVATAPDPQASLGFCASETADANRDKVRTLAYQHFGQSCGYWPDSTVNGFDKRNVRTGQYYLWSPLHLYAAVDAQHHITDPGAAEVIGYFTGDVTPPGGIDIKKVEIGAATIPKCAMEVWRDEDLGPIASYAPTEAEGGPCGCFFDAVATGATTCQACSDGDGGAACPASAPHCRYGFCEVN